MFNIYQFHVDSSVVSTSSLKQSMKMSPSRSAALMPRPWHAVHTTRGLCLLFVPSTGKWVLFFLICGRFLLSRFCILFWMKQIRFLGFCSKCQLLITCMNHVIAAEYVWQEYFPLNLYRITLLCVKLSVVLEAWYTIKVLSTL